MIASTNDLDLAASVESSAEPLFGASLATHDSHAAPSLQQVNALQIEALNTVASPVFAVLGDGHLVFANRAGKAALHAEQWVCHQGPRIAAAPRLWEQRSVTSALAGLRGGRSMTVLLTDSVTERQTILTAVPIRKQIMGSCRSAAGLIWLISTTSSVTPVGQLAQIFDVTKAEQRVVKQLVAGDELRKVAGSLHISIHTARNHLKSVFRKTGCRNQGQLLALAARMASVQIA